MKKINKRIATALIAAAMFAFTSVAASAADYGVTPSYPTPSVPSTPSTEEDKDVAGSTEDTAVTVVTDDVVADIIAAGETTIYAEADEVVVTEAAIGAIAKSDDVVTIDTGDYAIEIDPALIEEVKEIDLTMVITVEAEKSVTIAPAQKGEFGMTVKVTVPAATVKGLDTDNLKLYYISDDGDVTLIDDAIEVNADGSVSVTISHASEYVITDEELDAAEDDAVIEEVEDDDDAPVAEDTNPGTGVVLGTTALAACAAVAVISKKRK